MVGQRVAATRRRRSAIASSGMSTRKGRIPPSLDMNLNLPYWLTTMDDLNGRLRPRFPECPLRPPTVCSAVTGWHDAHTCGVPGRNEDDKTMPVAGHKLPFAPLSSHLITQDSPRSTPRHRAAHSPSDLNPALAGLIAERWMFRCAGVGFSLPSDTWTASWVTRPTARTSRSYVARTTLAAIARVKEAIPAVR